MTYGEFIPDDTDIDLPIDTPDPNPLVFERVAAGHWREPRHGITLVKINDGPRWEVRLPAPDAARGYRVLDGNAPGLAFAKKSAQDWARTGVVRTRTDWVPSALQARLADLSDRLTVLIRDDRLCPASVAAIRDEIDTLSGREPWKPGDSPRPPDEVNPAQAARQQARRNPPQEPRVNLNDPPAVHYYGDGCAAHPARTMGAPVVPCCPEFGRTGYAHTEICPAFERNDPARRAEPRGGVFLLRDDLTRRFASILEGTLTLPVPEVAGALADAALRAFDNPAGPDKGDAVETWLKRHRDRYRLPDGPLTGAWYALDAVLDDYRDHYHTGTPLDRDVQGPHPEES